MPVGGYPVLGSSKELLDIVIDQCVTDVVCAISHEMNPELFKSLISLEEQGVEVTTMPVVYEELMGRVPIALLQSDWIIRSFFDEATLRAL
jgi:FlaA1/EpsC-like NDP-sugar epimerase